MKFAPRLSITKGFARRMRPGFWRPGRRRRPIRPRRGARASTTWPLPTTTSTRTVGGGTWWREGFPINTSQGQESEKEFLHCFTVNHTLFSESLYYNTNSIPRPRRVNFLFFYPEFDLDHDDHFYENTKENRSRSPGYAIVV